MDNKITTNEWYQALLQDLKRLEYTGIVLTKWNIGKRIVQDELKFGNPEYGSKRIENLAKDLKVSTSDLWRCIQFYKKLEQNSHSVREFEDRSWNYIINTFLPTPKPKKELPKLPQGKYNIIYADPPWEYYKGGYKNQSQHYEGYTVEELKGMPMDDLAADNCVLFLWVTFPNCWTDNQNTIQDYVLIDLDKVRSGSLLDNRKTIANTDGTKFISIPLLELYKKDCLVSSKKYMNNLRV